MSCVLAQPTTGMCVVTACNCFPDLRTVGGPYHCLPFPHVPAHKSTGVLCPVTSNSSQTAMLLMPPPPARPTHAAFCHCCTFPCNPRIRYSEPDTMASLCPGTRCKNCSPSHSSGALFVCRTFMGNGSEIRISGEVESACENMPIPPTFAPLPQLLGQPVHIYQSPPFLCCPLNLCLGQPHCRLFLGLLCRREEGGAPC